jgi:hypothetical protein
VLRLFIIQIFAIFFAPPFFIWKIIFCAVHILKIRQHIALIILGLDIVVFIAFAVIFLDIIKEFLIKSVRYIVMKGLAIDFKFVDAKCGSCGKIRHNMFQFQFKEVN